MNEYELSPHHILDRLTMGEMRWFLLIRVLGYTSISFELTELYFYTFIAFKTHLQIKSEKKIKKLKLYRSNLNGKTELARTRPKMLNQREHKSILVSCKYSVPVSALVLDNPELDVLVSVLFKPISFIISCYKSKTTFSGI